MAVDDINENPAILPNHRLMLDIQNGQCEADVVMKKFIDFIKNKDPSKFRSMVGILGIRQTFNTNFVKHTLNIYPSEKLQIVLEFPSHIRVGD